MSDNLTTAGESNPFEIYGNAACRRPFIGELLKFVQGDFLVGQEYRELPLGTRLAALMQTLEVGWQFWEGYRPGERRMGLVSERFIPPKTQRAGRSRRKIVGCRRGRRQAARPLAIHQPNRDDRPGRHQ